MDNNSNQLLGWEAVADVFSSNTIDNNPLVTGNLREEQGEISDEEIARLQRQHKAPSVKDVFGDDAVKTPEKEEKGTEEPVVEDPTEEPAKDDKAAGKGKHIFSHVEWHMEGVRISLKTPIQSENYVWVLKKELENTYALPSAFEIFRKIL